MYTVTATFCAISLNTEKIINISDEACLITTPREQFVKKSFNLKLPLFLSQEYKVLPLCPKNLQYYTMTPQGPKIIGLSVWCTSIVQCTTVSPPMRHQHLSSNEPNTSLPISHHISPMSHHTSTNEPTHIS